MLFTTINTAIVPPLLLLPNWVTAVTDNGFDEMGMDGDVTAVNEVSSDTMECPVAKHGNRDKQRHEEELLNERQWHYVDSAETVLGLSWYRTREVLTADNPLIRPSTLTLHPDDEYSFAVHDLRIDSIIRRMAFRLCILVRADNRQLTQLRLGHTSSQRWAATGLNAEGDCHPE
jgi:hypothetical protein